MIVSNNITTCRLNRWVGSRRKVNRLPSYFVPGEFQIWQTYFIEQYNRTVTFCLNSIFQAFLFTHSTTIWLHPHVYKIPSNVTLDCSLILSTSSSNSSKLTHSMAPEVQCRIYKDYPIISIPSRINPINCIDTYFLKIHFNIVLTSTHRPS